MLNDEAALRGLADTLRRAFAFARGAKPNTHGTGTPMLFAVGLLTPQGIFDLRWRE
jgi:hypothetical protein